MIHVIMNHIGGNDWQVEIEEDYSWLSGSSGWFLHTGIDAFLCICSDRKKKKHHFLINLYASSLLVTPSTSRKALIDFFSSTKHPRILAHEGTNALLSIAKVRTEMISEWKTVKSVVYVNLRAAGTPLRSYSQTHASDSEDSKLIIQN